MGNDCMLSFTFQIDLLLKKYEYFWHFLFFKVDFNKYTIQYPMGHSRDDAVHKIPHKMKTPWQNQLKFSVLISFKILYRIRYKKIDVILVQCPFNDNKIFQGLSIIFSCGPQRAKDSSEIDVWGPIDHHYRMYFYVYWSWQRVKQAWSAGRIWPTGRHLRRPAINL